MRHGELPNLIVIGAAKCATTSFHYYLDQHPDITMSRVKEINFFSSHRNWRKGSDWYQRHFDANSAIRGESSVGYTFYPFYCGVAQRMHALIPKAKLIYSIRDPIERIISNYIHSVSDGNERRPIEIALADFDNCVYISKSKYFMQLEQYLAFYHPEDILIVTVEEMMKKRVETLRGVFRFLEIDDTFVTARFFTVKHRTSQKRQKNAIGLFLKRLSETPPAGLFSADFRRRIGKIVYRPFSAPLAKPILNDELRLKLVEYLEPDVEALREFTGRRFKSWSL
ncbi:MAG: sulfotransferase family protein [Thermodesulfobacteriota bacterium]